MGHLNSFSARGGRGGFEPKISKNSNARGISRGMMMMIIIMLKKLILASIFTGT